MTARERAEQLFTKLDGMARAFDKYEYGLYGGWMLLTSEEAPHD